MFVATGHIVEVHEHIVEIAAGGMDIHVVYIALGAVEEDALGVVQYLLHGLAGEAGPVSGNLAAAHHIGVVAEVNKGKALTVFPVKTQHIHPLVHITDGVQDIGIVNTGIGADGAVLHTETADKSNIGCVTDAVAHLGRLQIVQSHLGYVAHLPCHGLGIFDLQRIGGVGIQERTGVGVGGVDVHSLPGKTGHIADLLTHRIQHGLHNATVVNGDENGLAVTAGNGQTVDLQLVQNTVSFATNLVAGHTDAQHRGNIYTGKTYL